MKYALIALLIVPSIGMACSDPVKHREHLLREMQAAQTERTQGASPVSQTRGADANQNSLDASEQFFGSVGRANEGAESSRRRGR